MVVQILKTHVKMHANFVLNYDVVKWMSLKFLTLVGTEITTPYPRP